MCYFNYPLVAYWVTPMQPEKRGSVIMRKCHLVVEAALKEGVALQELHLEEIREGLAWLCTNAMWDWLAFQCTIFPAWCAFQCTIFPEDSNVENDEECHPSRFFCSLW